jgi:uncharacterized membrane protein (UPF0127 family)
MKNYIKIKNIKIEDPDFFITKEEQQAGFQNNENPRCGAFPYLYGENRKFWMKDTPKDLDIVFCNEGKVVHYCKGEALSEQLVGPDVCSDLVLEFPFGFCETFGIIIGDKVKCKLSKKNRKKLLKQNGI